MKKKMLKFKRISLKDAAKLEAAGYIICISNPVVK